MGTRIFNRGEQPDSRIKWEVADSITTKKLCEAIRKKNYGKIGRVIVYLPFVFLVTIFCMFLFVLVSNFIQLQNEGSQSEWIFVICFATVSLLGFLVFFIFLVRNYRKTIPYLYPEKQKNIWIFSATCSDVTPYYVSGDTEHYSAYFQKGGIFIAIRITGYECKNKIPVGKEYLFYKFNDNTGNQWAAISKETLDEISV